MLGTFYAYNTELLLFSILCGHAVIYVSKKIFLFIFWRLFSVNNVQELWQMVCLCHGIELCSPHVGFRNVWYGSFRQDEQSTWGCHHLSCTSLFPVSVYWYSLVHAVKLLSPLIFKKSSLYTLYYTNLNIILYSVL